MQKGSSSEEILTSLLAVNDLNCDPPLDRSEISKIATSVERYRKAKTASKIVSPGLSALRLSEVETTDVEWLWHQILPLGSFCLMDGAEGVGKTFVALAIADAVGKGEGLPGNGTTEQREPANSLIISAEDSLSHVLKKRLEVMGARTERIIAIDQRFALDVTGLRNLEEVIAEYTPLFVVIDPLFSYVGRINLNDDSDIRSITDPLKRLAEKYGCTILGIRHIGKTKGLGDPRNAGLNGIGWRASARSCLLVGQDPKNDKQKVICHTKSNYGLTLSRSIGFELREGALVWTGESHVSADDLLRAVSNVSPAAKREIDEAHEFLKDCLKDGPKQGKLVLEMGKLAGHSEVTLRRAKNEFNVKSKKIKGVIDGPWMWTLP